MADEAVLNELKDIKRYLSIVATALTAPAVRAFEERVLNTDSQRNMFRAIDGQRNATQLAAAGSIGARGAQLFVESLRKRGYVTSSESGEPTIDYGAILTWYETQAGGSTN